MEATTDSEANIRFDFDRQPGISNLLQILALLTGKSQSQVNADWENKTSYGELKQAVAEIVQSFLADLQAKLTAIDDKKLMQKLEADEATMCKVADATLLKVQKAVGLRPA